MNSEDLTKIIVRHERDLINKGLGAALMLETT